MINFFLSDLKFFCSLNYFQGIKTYNIIKKCAFSLAEILIIAGIIGIVAELTIPNLVYAEYELATIATIKKTFAMCATGFNNSVTENGTPDTWGLIGPGDSVGLANINDAITKQFNVAQNCGTGAGCFPDTKYRNLKGKENDTVLDQDTTYTKFRLIDGSSIAIKQFSSNCNENWGDSMPLQNVCGIFCFDINGNGSPNTYGKDFFGFAFTKYGLVPLGSPIQTKAYSFEDYCNKSSNENSLYPNGLSCTAWVMYQENMDYETKYYLSWNNDNDSNNSNGNCGNGVGKGGHDGSGLGNGVGNTCKGNGNH